MLSSSATFRNIPSVDELLRSDVLREISSNSGPAFATALARQAQDHLREAIVSDPHTVAAKEELLTKGMERLRELLRQDNSRRLQKVINCTGVVIHTNLGRAPLSRDAMKAIANEAGGYCTLEYDLTTGKRGRRAPKCEDLIADITGAEAALIVNNCAAAAYFILTAFARGAQVVISRGELVEIGGDFRIPDVLEQSGASLREVGTTNRTRLDDYANALDGGATFILRVHPSNYRIVGFTSTPSLSELSKLARERGVILYEDIGSGALVDLTENGIIEPLVSDSIAAGVDLVTFSGDKLLGGPQAGIIAGKGSLIDSLRRHPLYRALRVGKLEYAALEATLLAYRRGSVADIPVISMLSLDVDGIRARAQALIARLEEGHLRDLSFEIREGQSAVGGGAAPGIGIPTILIEVRHSTMTPDRIEDALRSAQPPVVTRIENDAVLIDLRTVFPDEESLLVDILTSLF